MKTALTIAGSDCSGGAGIQADLKTFLANGVYGMSAITALTAQNTCGVRSVLNSTAEFLSDQLYAIFEDIFPDAVKVGMVSSAALIEVIAEKLTHYGAKNIVVDPVMVATSGARLIDEDAVKTLEEKLFPLAKVITPNLPELEIIVSEKISSPRDTEILSQYEAERDGLYQMV
ncbi:MAG: bifunctional hydroxymethylpyrimidine kinase/phosphomethylpyrimidine kinase [Selenomonadaceae bacterium]|nr:bifunctional hydroxymethylpyrimidine kinase/phosphomethylpyrimidine kinase [Selenomonadaceae bacterium]